MAKIKYSALVSDMRGKLNGSVASKNRFGSYLRNKVTPVNPQTDAQQNARQRFGNISSAFRALGAAGVTAWNDAAKNFPVNNIFGDQVYLSGQQLFNQLNGNLLKIGGEISTAAPEPVSFPNYSIDASGAGVTAGGPAEWSLVISDLAEDPTGMRLAVYATRPLPASRSFIKTEYRFLGSFTAPEASEDLDIAARYYSRFGAIEEGAKVGIRVALVSEATGQQGVPQEVVLVATAP